MMVRVGSLRPWGWCVLGSLFLHGTCLWVGWGAGVSPSGRSMTQSVVGVQLMGSDEAGPVREDGDSVSKERTPSKVAPATKANPAEALTPSPHPNPSELTPRPVGERNTAGVSGAMPMNGSPTTQGSAPNPSGKGGRASEEGGGHIVTIAGPVQTGNPSPIYPPQAREWGQQGVVVLKVNVLKTGRVHEVLVMTSSGYPLLDRSAVEAVKRWGFNPARTATDTLDSWVTLPIRFRLAD